MNIPASITKYFWGDDLQELDFQKHQKYIAQTLLEKGDSAATHWLFTQMPKAQIKSLLPQLKLSKKSANFWSLYL